MLLLLEDKDGRWQPPEEQSLLDGDAGIWDFALSPDGEFLYLTSDAPVEGAGRANLWRVRRESEGWGIPEPLGPEVNTGGNESHPSVSENGTLYFFRRDGDAARPEHAREREPGHLLDDGGVPEGAAALRRRSVR